MTTAQLSTMYERAMPTMDEVQAYTLPELQAFVRRVEADVGLLNEECRMFTTYLQAQKEKEQAGLRDDDDGVDDAPQATKTTGARTGKSYQSQKAEQKAVGLTIESKTKILHQSVDALKQERDRAERVMEDAREQYRATLEEAVNRIKEIHMEMAHFSRDVTVDGKVVAEKVLQWMNDRPEAQTKHVTNMRDKANHSQQQINKYLGQLKQREDVGEAFHEIDFSQLEIENQQFMERIEQKNEELVELKGTTTRTVQMLNGLTDKLGALTTEQAQLRKELKLRQEHVDKLTDEIEQVKKEGAVAQKKNTNLKIQHESVKVPKVEDYIAQKAETYEPQKAVQNWKRKVEIASGHVAVMKQQMLSLRKKLGLSTTKM